MKHRPYYKAVRRAIRLYPKRAAMIEELKAQHGDGVPARSPGRVSRPTEHLALLTLKDEQAQAEYDAVKTAIERTRQMETGAARLKVIAVKYWRAAPGDLAAAAAEIHYSEQQTWRFHVEFEQLVARLLNMEIDDGENVIL